MSDAPGQPPPPSPTGPAPLAGVPGAPFAARGAAEPAGLTGRRARMVPGPLPENERKLAEELLLVLLQEAEKVGEDPRRLGPLLHEAGLASRLLGDVAGAAQLFLRAYTVLPRFRPNLRAARRLYGERAEYPLVAKLLEAEARASKVPTEQAALRRLAARVLDERLEDRRGALDMARQALACDPGDVASLLLIERLLGSSVPAPGQGQERADYLRQLAEVMIDPGVRAAALWDLARLLWSSEDLDGAARYLGEALAILPGHAALLGDLARIHQNRGNWELLVGVLELELAARTSVRIGPGLHSSPGLPIPPELPGPFGPGTSGVLELVRPGSHPDPRPRSNFRAIELTQPISIATTPADAAADAATQGPALAALHARIGRLLRFQLRQPEQAVNAFHRAVLASPRDPLLCAEYAELAEELGRWESVVWAGEREAEIETDPDQLAALFHRLGAICAGPMGDDERAAHYLRRALEQAPSYLPALELLGRIYGRRGEWDRLARMHLSEAEGAFQPERRAARYYAAAEVFERRLQDTERAISNYARALREVPHYPPAVVALERLYARTGRWQELLGTYERELVDEQHSGRKMALLEVIAELWQERVGNPERAIATYRMLMELETDHLPAIRALGRLYAQTARWSDLCDINERELLATTDARRAIDLLMTTGEVQEHRLLDTTRATRCYERALVLDPRHVPALRALGALHRRSDRFESLLAMHRAELEAILATTADAAQLHEAELLLYRIAEIYAEDLRRPELAEGTLRELLGRFPDSWAGRAALEEIFEARDDDAALAELWQRDLQLVMPGGFKIGGQTSASEERSEPGGLGLDEMSALALRELARPVVPVAELAPEKRRELATRLQLLGACQEDRLGDDEAARRSYHQALDLDPGNVLAFTSLFMLLVRLGQDSELADLIEHRCAELPPGLRAWMFSELGDLQESRLKDPAAALGAYARALEVGPGDLASLRALARAQSRAGAPAAAATTLEKAVLAAAEGPDAAALLLELAHGREESGRPDAEDAYLEALRHNPGLVMANRGLQRLRRRRQGAEDAGDHAEALRRWLDHLLEPISATERACALVEIAEAQESRGALPGAERLYREALNCSPGQPAALLGLQRLLRVAGRFAELAELIEQAAASAESRDVRQALRREAAALWEGPAHRLDLAVENYAEILRVQPTDEAAFQRLTGLLRKGPEMSLLAEALRGRLVAGSLGREAELLLQLELSSLCLDQLGERRKGMAALRRVVELDPAHHASLVKLAELYELESQPERAEAHWQRAIGAAPDDHTLGEHARRLGRLRLTLGDAEGALVAFEQALSRLPDDVELLERQAELRQTRGDALGAVLALERLLTLTPSGSADRVGRHLQAAQICEEQLEDGERALDHYRKALLLDPVNLLAVQRLAGLLGRAGNRGALERHLESSAAALRRTLGESFDVELLRRLARVHQWQRTFDRVYVVLSLIDHLEELPGPEVAFVRSHGEGLPTLPQRGLQSERYQVLLLHPRVRGLLRDLVVAAGEDLGRVIERDVSAYGTRRVKIHPDSPWKRTVDALVMAFGAPPFEAFVVPGWTGTMAVEALPNPVLLISDRHAQELPDAKARFHLGRAVLYAAEQALPLLALDPAQQGMLVAAVARVASPEFQPPDGLVDGRVLVDLPSTTRKLGKVISRKARKALEQYGPILGRGQPLDMAAYRHGLVHSANRAGLLAAADIGVGLTEAGLVARSGRPLPASAAAGDPAAALAELLRFMLSDDHFTLRRELGLAGAGS